MFKLLISITLASSLLVLNACEANGPKYRNVRSFSEGLAPVQSANGKWGYINERQQFVIQPKFQDAKEFQGGKAPAKKMANGVLLISAVSGYESFRLSNHTPYYFGSLI